MTQYLAKKTDVRKWLADVSSVPLQQSLRHLDAAYKNFFNSRNGNRLGGKVGVPKFKKKTENQSAEFTKAGFRVKNGEVYLAKIGNICPIWSRVLPNEHSSVTVIKDCAGRYFLSFVVEVEPINTDAKNQSIGIDLGIKTFAVMSNGEKVESPNYSKIDRKIRKLQRKLARQQKGSKRMRDCGRNYSPRNSRRNVTRIRIAKLHNQITDTRKDFLHKLSSRVVLENQIVVLEDLNVSGMVKNRRLARAISLQGWREFRNLCEAKSDKLGRTFQAINRWEPTSQVCSDCGYRWGKLDLTIREILCINCNSRHCRDENASRNIEKVGIGHCHDSKRAGRDCKTTPVASFNEPSRITAALAQ